MKSWVPLSAQLLVAHNRRYIELGAWNFIWSSCSIQDHFVLNIITVGPHKWEKLLLKAAYNMNRAEQSNGFWPLSSFNAERLFWFDNRTEQSIHLYDMISVCMVCFFLCLIRSFSVSPYLCLFHSLYLLFLAAMVALVETFHALNALTQQIKTEIHLCEKHRPKEKHTSNV